MWSTSCCGTAAVDETDPDAGAGTEEVAARDEGKPDEGLPAIKGPIVEHLEKDVNDPNSAEALETIRLFEKQKQKCHDQVKWIFSHPKNNNLQTIDKAKEMRAAALETWKRVQALLAQKIKDDALITEFSEGHRVNITLIGAENLPMFDQVI